MYRPNHRRPSNIVNVLASYGIPWHIYSMGIMRQRAWNSLGIGLLGVIALSACGTWPTAPVEHKSDSAATHAGIIQSLQKQIRERDKRIADLESRLDALKVIDQDIEKRKTFGRPPTMVTPADNSDPH